MQNTQASQPLVHACIGLSLICGAIAANWVAPSGQSATAEPVHLPVDSRHLDDLLLDESSSSTRSSKDSVQYVQEPARRTSRLPDKRPLFAERPDRDERSMLLAFQDATKDCVFCTTRLSVAGHQIAFGAIVDSSGWVATKSTLIPDGESLVCTLYDRSEHEATVVSRDEDLDLALVRIEASDLPVLPWATNLPTRGRWLATTDINRSPAAVGVSSAPVQSVRKARAVLGIFVEDTVLGGAQVKEVVAGTGADRSGLRHGDRIVELAGSAISSKRDFLEKIAGGRGGDKVDLVVFRNETKLNITARLMDLSDELLDDTEMEVSGRVSYRATDFAKVLVHDTVLDPTQCGGPLVNLDGNAVGLNIARAGRVSSYALPADIVRPAIQNLLREAKLISSDQPQSALRPIQ